MVVRLPSDLDVLDSNNGAIPNSSGGTDSVAEGGTAAALNNVLRSLGAVVAAGYGHLPNGASRPSQVQSGALWVSSAGVLSFYDGTDDIALASIDTAANTLTLTADITGALTGNASTATALNNVALSTAGISDLVDIATQADAEGATIDNEAMTPLRVAQAIAALGPSLDVYTDEYTTAGSFTATIPFDDTAPGSAEGSALLSVSNVTLVAGDRVVVFVNSTAANSGTNRNTFALFRDTTCIQAKTYDQHPGVDIGGLSMVHAETPGAGTYSYSVRVGPDAGTMYVNADNNGNRRFGGEAGARLIAKVYKDGYRSPASQTAQQPMFFVIDHTADTMTGTIPAASPDYNDDVSATTVDFFIEQIIEALVDRSPGRPNATNRFAADRPVYFYLMGRETNPAGDEPLVASLQTTVGNIVDAYNQNNLESGFFVGWSTVSGSESSSIDFGLALSQVRTVLTGSEVSSDIIFITSSSGADTSTYTTTDDGKVYATTITPPPPQIYVDGWASSTVREFDELALLTSSNIRVVAYDQATSGQQAAEYAIMNAVDNTGTATSVFTPNTINVQSLITADA